jgi:hypothetical protein
MDSDFGQVAQRLMAVHIRTIITLALIGATGGFLLQHGHVSTFTATARVILDTSVPQTAGESQAIADTVQAVVTAPGHVARALNTVGFKGDATSIAKHDVAVQAVGTSSGVLGLSVKNPDPIVAAALANALATDLIVTRQQARDAELTSLATVLKTTLSALPPGIDQSNALAQSLVQLHTNSVLQSQPSVVDPATAPVHPDPSGLLPNLGLGLVLGLGLGMAWAAFAESFHPTLMGPRAIADAMGTPLIGLLSAHNGAASELDSLALRIWLRVSSTGTTRVRVVAAAPDMRMITEQLTRTLGADRVEERERLGHVEVTYQLALPQRRIGAGGEQFRAPSFTSAGNGDVNGNGTGTRRAGSPARKADNRYTSPLRGATRGSDHTLLTGELGRHSHRGTDDATLEAIREAGGEGLDDGSSWGVLVVTPEHLKRTALSPICDDIAITGEKLLGVVVTTHRRGLRWRSTP